MFPGAYNLIRKADPTYFDNVNIIAVPDPTDWTKVHWLRQEPDGTFLPEKNSVDGLNAALGLGVIPPEQIGGQTVVEASTFGSGSMLVVGLIAAVGLWLVLRR